LLFVSCIWYVTCFGFVGFACSHDKIQAHKVLEEMDALFLSLFLVLIRTGRKCWTDIAIHDMVSISVYACHLKWRLSSFDTWRFCMSFVWQMWRFPFLYDRTLKIGSLSWVRWCSDTKSLPSLCTAPTTLPKCAADHQSGWTNGVWGSPRLWLA
jgi:hypothetical protein